jgi:hypothetical protein
MPLTELLALSLIAIPKAEGGRRCEGRGPYRRNAISCQAFWGTSPARDELAWAWPVLLDVVVAARARRDHIRRYDRSGCVVGMSTAPGPRRQLRPGCLVAYDSDYPGGMLAFILKKFVGSYLALRAVSRVH